MQPYLAYIREQSVELETVLTFFRSLRTSLGSYCLQAPEDALQVGVTLSEVYWQSLQFCYTMGPWLKRVDTSQTLQVCQYGHALIHDPTHEDSSNLVESVQVSTSAADCNGQAQDCFNIGVLGFSGTVLHCHRGSVSPA